MKTTYITLAILLGFHINMKAQASFLKKINNTNSTSSSMGRGLEFNGYHYFTASKGFQSTMWKTDGTPNGTTDFIDSDDAAGATPIFIFNNELYYLASETGGTFVYKTDGTIKTVFLQEDATTPVVGFDKRTVAIINTNFVFRHGTVSSGYELFISDGTPNNATLVKDINPSGSSSPNYITNLGSNKVVFIANDGVSGQEIWVSDGTSSGTNMIKELNSSGSNFITGLTSYNGKVYFNFNGQIWETDGTDLGTKLFLDLRSKGDSEYPFYEFKNELYFTAYNAAFDAIDLWKTDGTVAGSMILTTGLNDVENIFQKTNNLLFFAADTDAYGYELWRTDGTAAGTYLTKDIYAGPGPESGLGTFLSKDDFGNGGDKLFFQANLHDINGNVVANETQELWSSDGTESGTILNTTINNNGTGSVARSFVNVNDKLVFRTDIDEDGNYSNQGINLWVVDTNVLAVKENDIEKNSITIYPNPTQDWLHINGDLTNLATATIFSIQAREIAAITNFEFGISVTNLSKGTYFLKLKFNDGRIDTSKFLKL